MDLEIKQNKLSKEHLTPGGCAWHTTKEGKIYFKDSILPNNICPWLYHTVYPYFLGLIYGAKFDRYRGKGEPKGAHKNITNEQGDCKVCCPACKGVDTVVKLRDNDGTFDPRISKDIEYVIFAEVVRVRGNCPYGHKVGQRFIFPTCMKEHYLCPAGFNNIFPLLNLELPPCIDLSNLRCPDWVDTNVITFDITKQNENLMHGENPYQKPAHICKDLNCAELKKIFQAQSINLKKVSGELPCYTNIADLDNLLTTLYLVSSAFDKNYKKIPFISIAAKHGNPCGLSIDWAEPEKTVRQALLGNPTAIWGGEFILNFPVTKKIADLLYEGKERGKWMLDVIAAPEIEKEAEELLGKRKRTKIYASKGLTDLKALENSYVAKSIRNGLLVQPPNNYVLDFAQLDWVQKPEDEKYMSSIIVGWAVAYSSFHGGNEVAIAKDNCLIGVGGGPSTIEAAKIAVWRAAENNHFAKGSVFAADAFFPFTDAPEVLKDAGCICGVVPAGGVNHLKIKKYFDDNDIKCGFIPEIYRGFCRH